MLSKSMLAGILVLAGSIAHASVLTPTTPDSLVLTVLSLNADNSVIGYDLRGTVAGTVDAIPETLYISDGTPLGLPAPPIPNIFLLMINGTLTQSGILTFGLPAVGGPGLVQDSTFAPNTAISDPALLAITGGTLAFDWAFTSSGPGPVISDRNTTLSTWHLVDATSTSTPEPASMALMGVGALFIVLARKKRS
jgi:hypothetical protein